ncbi:MAG TPA: hypothetical protein VMH86_10975 [Rhizomicrobium sp.]|nr:hypothetical protein [Rhizomicrobium sp.]
MPICTTHVVICFLYDWQTFIAAFVAFLGAYITVRTMNRQARETAKRKRRAVRALLPSVINEVHQYAVSNVRWLNATLEKGRFVDTQVVPPGSIPVGTRPVPDLGMLLRLADAAEHLDDGAADFIRGLLSRIQVLYARTDSLQDYFDNYHSYSSKKVGVVREITRYTADSLETLAYAYRVFPYARFETDAAPTPPDFAAIAPTFRVTGMGEHQYPDVWNELTKRYPPPTRIAN